MCGRVVLARPVDVLAELFDAVPAPRLSGSYQASWNIAPTHPVVGLTAGDGRAGGGAGGGRDLDLYQWGLRGRFFNARAETVATNGTFSPALRARRMAVLVDGFYEWQHGPDRRRGRPLFFHRADGLPMAIAGLWEPWRSDGALLACTMVTTAAGADLDGIHDRTPVVLEPEALALWLGATQLDRGALAGVVRPGPLGTLVHHRVDPRVGDVRNDGPDLVVPYEERLEPEPLRLFG